jgi:hypothetical protein
MRPALTWARTPLRSPTTAIAPGKIESRTERSSSVRSESSRVGGSVSNAAAAPSPPEKKPGSVVGARPRKGSRPVIARAAALSIASPRPNAAT